MIHVATVHWKTADWIDLQARFLTKNLPEPFRVYAWLDEIEGGPEPHAGKFHYVRTGREFEHAHKLNALAQTIAEQAESDADVVIFIDSDAFPIQPLGPFLQETLAAVPLAAIQRRENNGDRQPHPCFCATTIGVWKRLPGDWRRGFQWPDNQGNLVTDVGGNLLGLLEQQGLAWHPMLRSNKKNPHPLCFAVYEDLVYHHGAGSRVPISRDDLKNIRGRHFFENLHIRITRRLPAHSIFAKIYFVFFIIWCRLMLGKKTFDTMKAGRELMQSMQHDDEFYRRLL